jgi:hypothetical protein
MRRISANLALAGLLVAAPSVATSQTNISQHAQFSPSSTVQYLPFNVSTMGTFDMFTSGLGELDPMLLLYSGASSNGAGLGSLLTSNDDGGLAQAGWNHCTGLGGTCHSRIFQALATGDYTLVYGVFNLTDGEARAGFANVGPQDVLPGTSYGGAPYCNAQGVWDTCNYDVSITSVNGVATVTPEPASLTLLATGLLGVFGVARRKRKSRLTA